MTEIEFIHLQQRQFPTPFCLFFSARSPRNTHARVSRAMGQFFLKIAHLSFSMGPTPILKMAVSYGLHPRLWLLLSCNTPCSCKNSKLPLSRTRKTNTCSIQLSWRLQAVELLFSDFCRLRVVSNFGDGDCGAGKIHTRAREISRRRDAKGAPPRTFARARVYFARPTITIAKIRDYSQSMIFGI